MKKNLRIGLFVQLIVSGAPLMADLFIPQFAETLGASKFEIGVLGTAFALSMFLSSAFFGRVSDMFGRKRILIFGFLFSGLFYAVSFFSVSFRSFFLLRVFQGIAIGIYPGALAAYVSESKGSMEDYVAYGALGIALFLYLAGVIAGLFSVRRIFIFVGIFYLVSILLVSGIREEFGEKIEVPLFPLNVIKRNIFLYLAIFLTFTGITITWTYWVIFLRDIGTSRYATGYITMLNPLSEFLTLKFIAKRIRFRSTKFGMLILAVSFPVYAFAKSPLALVPLQLFSGIGWAFMYSGGLSDIMRLNKEKGTASGLFQSSVSMGNIVGPFVAGVVFFVFKSLQAEFLFAGIFIFAGFSFLLLKDILLKKKFLPKGE